MSKNRNRSRSRAAVMRRKQRIVELNLATRGLCVHVADWYISGTRGPNDWQPNLCWEEVRVRRCDVAAYLAAMNQWLMASWTPNQGFGFGTCNYDGYNDRLRAAAQMEALRRSS